MFPSEIGQGGLAETAFTNSKFLRRAQRARPTKSRLTARSARTPYLLWMGFPFGWPIPFAKNAVRMVRFMGLLRLMILRARL